MKNFLRRLFGGWRVRFDRPERMTDAELYEALSVDAGHPVYRALMELAARAQQDARDQARNVVGDHAECAYYLGAEWAMESLVEYAAAARLEAQRRIQSQNDAG
jgi:hypothetical protein